VAWRVRRMALVAWRYPALPAKTYVAQFALIGAFWHDSFGDVPADLRGRRLEELLVLSTPRPEAFGFFLREFSELMCD
jgi:hypothetical protein